MKKRVVLHIHIQFCNLRLQRRIKKKHENSQVVLQQPVGTYTFFWRILYLHCRVSEKFN